MNTKLLLHSMILLSFTPGVALAQTNPVYTGTFTNATLTQDGIMTLSMSVTQPDSIHGYINFTQKTGQSPLCGAGSYSGHIVSDSLFLSFSSNDTDSSCGYDYGWLFSLEGRFYANKDSIAGKYSINNVNNETGFFNVKRPSTATAIGNAGKQLPVIYPNPASGKFAIKMPQYLPGTTLIITDPLGGKVLVKQLTSDTTDIDLAVSDGIYFITIISNGKRTVQKLVIRH